MAFDPRWMRRTAEGNPIHNPYPNRSTMWTTVNAGEVFPGVPTPLTWSICGASFEVATRRGCGAIGGLRQDEIALPESVDDRMFNIWFGRATLNVSMLGKVANGMPGSSSDSIEEAYFGGALPETSSKALWTRYPTVAVKMPVAAVRASRVIRRLTDETDAWWRRTLADLPADPSALVNLLYEAYDRMADVTSYHVTNTMVGGGVFDIVRKLAERAGSPELAATAITGGDSPETQTVADLWEVAQGRGSLEAFVGEYGFHGPGESELSSRSWREDQTPLHRLLNTYRQLDQDASPQVLQVRKHHAAAEAQRRLIESCGSAVRPAMPKLLALATAYSGMREVGRVTLLRTVDVTRAAARRLGEILADRAVIESPDDVFYLTGEEVVALTQHGKVAGDHRSDIAQRRELRITYQGMEIPNRFVDDCVATSAEAVQDVSSVEGIGASTGVVRGQVRVMLEAGEDDLVPGEILVCRTTDPGWASYFQAAGGVVIEIGGQMSHGAIVAREIGIPCVINVASATRAFRTGDTIEVDGDRGVVTVISRAQHAAAESEQAPSAVTGVDRGRHLAALNVIRLKGSASPQAIGAALGGDAESVQTVIDELVDAGAVKVGPRGVRITKPGREVLGDLLTQERQGVDPAAMAAVYEEFTAVNNPFKDLVTRWQQRDGEPNDHLDAGYDGQILSELAGIDGRLQPILTRIGEILPRLKRYPPLFAAARERIDAGEHDWLLNPVLDSYHTVWFELHEELILASGHSRAAEAAAGRAE